MFFQTLSAKLSIYSRVTKNKLNIFCYSCPVSLSFLILTFLRDSNDCPLISESLPARSYPHAILRQMDMEDTIV